MSIAFGVDTGLAVNPQGNTLAYALPPHKILFFSASYKNVLFYFKIAVNEQAV